jgi:hypothetical protein
LVLDHAWSNVRGVLHSCPVMIDSDWLLWCRALIDYMSAASTQLLTRTRRDAVTNRVDELTETSTIGRVQHTTIRKLGYTIAGLVLALIVGPLFVIGIYTIITSLAGR